MNLGAPEIIIIAIVIFALFGYKKLPDASRAIGRSLRIFKGEMKGMKDDDVTTKAEAETVRSPIPPAAPVPPATPTAPPAQAYAPPPAPSAPTPAQAQAPTVIDPTGAPAAPPSQR